MRVCTKCEIEKEFSEFWKSSHPTADGTGLHHQCKTCKGNYMREHHLKTTYGITLAQYNEMIISQNYCCAICGIHQDLTEGYRRKGVLDIDHHHGNNIIRGLLCNSCNTALGKFKDDINILKSAIEYLKKYKMV